ncbi:ARM repeat superfamily protein [Actinidia rufa]|uniref:ARM repeat superfamily protein n=1 Tax=Actinidia rufa TaxID=165716 RepID=A0A7J0FXH5_9ERIC|nr:ARM repeat superfamily protein [Actinidia rufa]
MVSLQDSHSISSRLPATRPLYSLSSVSSSKIQRSLGRSMRTIRSNLYQTDHSCSFTGSIARNRPSVSTRRVAATSPASYRGSPVFQRRRIRRIRTQSPSPSPSRVRGFSTARASRRRLSRAYRRRIFSRRFKICIDGLQSPSVAVKRSAAAKLRLLAKNRSDNRALIGESGAVPALIPLLRHQIPNLRVKDRHWNVEAERGLRSAQLVVDRREPAFDRCVRAIPPLVSLMINGSNRGKKDALTTLYKLCSAKLNKERAVSAGAVGPLVGLVAEQGTGMAEKAMVVLSSLAAVPEGKEAIVEEGGIPALVEAIEDGSAKGKEFAVLTLLQLCADSVRNRGFASERRWDTASGRAFADRHC